MIELVVSDILCKTSDERAYVMMLKELNGHRKIMVVIGYAEAQAIAFALKGIVTKRPITHDLFHNFAKSVGATMQCATISKIDDGTFYSTLMFRINDELREIDARTSDAVAVALRFGAPIYIEEELLKRTAIHDEFNGAVSIPITIADNETLRNVLDKAIKEENYELAMKIKEEIDSRNTQNDTPEEDNKL